MLLVKYEHLHNRFSGDSDFDAPQKFHNTNISRIGGVAIFLAILISGFYRVFFENTGGQEIFLMALASFPAFIAGISEDISKRAGIKIRLLGTALSALIFGYIFNSWITNTGLYYLDFLFFAPFFSIFFTVFAICGVSNAFNIIDGFNGLASFVAVISLIAISYVGFKVNDPLIFITGMVMIGAILGFIFWNYPKGYIFLGDGGAYLIGFWVACLSVLLVSRNQTVSPMFALLVNAYPTVETLFTIWRRKFHKNKNPGIADDMHFHSLVYRRVVRWDDQDIGRIVSKSANTRTSPYLWALHSWAAIPACLFSDLTSVQLGIFILFVFLYIYFFKMIIQFKVPTWIK